MPIPLRIDPADSVCRRHAIDLLGGPRLSHILAMRKHDDIADALLGTGFEAVRQDYLGNAVAVDVKASGVQRARNIRCQDMPFPVGFSNHATSVARSSIAIAPQPTTQGTPMPRATTAACELLPPTANQGPKVPAGVGIPVGRMVRGKP